MPDITNIPLLFTVVSQILGVFLYVLLMKNRMKGYPLAVLTAVFLFLHAALLLFTKNQNPKYSILYLLAALLLEYAYLMVTCRVNALSNAYCCIRGFTLGEFAASAEWLIYVWFTRVTGRHNKILEILFASSLFLIFYAFMYYMEKIVQYDYEKMPIHWKDFIYTTAFAYAGFRLANSVKINVGYTQETTLALYNTRALVSFGTVAILYAAHALRREIYSKNEVDTLQYLMENQYRQYQQTKESSDMINMKYHDLKHQIHLLKQETESQKRIESLEKMEEAINHYERKSETGNELLDIIITEKKRYCIDHDIMFTCVADGEALQFMDMMDVCSIHGNALDNAIECEMKVEDKSKRVIHMLIANQKKFLLIKIDNYCEQPIKMEHGLPLTTKSDARFHGFGMKSMKYTVEKYNGMLTTGYENNWFELKILIPIP